MAENDQPSANPPAQTVSILALTALLATAGIAFHAIGLARPFGLAQFAAGNGFGVFARNYAKFGIVELRGTPVGPLVHRTLAETRASFSAPYFNHPPGMCWLNWLVGPDEQHLRLVTAVGHIAAALLLFHILIAHMGRGRAWLGGALLLGVPVLGFYGQVGCETTVMPLGLLMLLAAERAAAPGRRRVLWLAILAASAWLGPWMDWQFGFFSLGLAVWCWNGDVRGTLRRLWLPWAVTATSVGMILLWRAWAMAVFEGLPVQGVESVAALVQRVVVQRPPALEMLAKMAERMLEGFTLPVLLLGGVGLGPLLAGHARLGLGLLVVALLNPLIFGDYATTHIVYHAYAAPLLAAAGAALARGRLLAMAAGAVCGYSAWTMVEVRAWADTGFYRDLGSSLSRAAAGSPGLGAHREAYVCTNFPQHYGCYVTSPMVLLTPLVDPRQLEATRARPEQGVGLRYLWVHTEGAATGPLPNYATLPRLAGLKAYLDAFPSERVPALEVRLRVPPQGWEMAVREARIYTLREP